MIDESELTQSLRDCGIPERMQGGIIRYIVNYIKPGDFLCAVITNNLKETFGKADEENQGIIRNYVNWFHNYAPGPCWGSEGKMMKWLGCTKEAWRP